MLGSNRFFSWTTRPPYSGTLWLTWIFVLLSCLLSGGGPFVGKLIWFDDNVRMVQVLDWINGASWYDHTIHRVNGPEGFHTIWSRLVDIPIATVIVLFQPYIGQKKAALLASVLIPLIQTLLLFFVTSYMARPLVGRRYAKLITLFVLFCSCINAEYFTLAGFQLGAAGHHAWYVLLTTLFFGAAARSCIRTSTKDIWLSALAISGLLAVGIEGLPLIAGVCLTLACIAALQNRPSIALDAAKFCCLGTLVSLLLLPANQPLEKLLTPSFAEPSILGPVLIFCAASFFASQYVLIKQWGHQKGKVFAATVILGSCLTVLLVCFFPEILAGPAASLSPEERQLAAREHTEAMSLFRVAINTLDYVRMIFPSLLGISFACYSLTCRQTQRRQALILFYLGLSLTTFTMASLYSRYFHYTGLIASLWLLAAWLKMCDRLTKNRFYVLKSFLLYTSLGPLWLLVIPAINYQQAFVTHILLFPAKHQTERDICDPRSMAAYLDAHYPPETLLLVPMYRSAGFLFQSHLNIFFLASFPSNNKFIEAREFYDTTHQDVAHHIAVQHKIDLVAICKPVYHVTPESLFINKLLKGRMSFGQQLVIGNTPSWLHPIDTQIETPYLLFAVDKGG